MRPDQEEKMSELKCLEVEAGLTVGLKSSSAVHLRQTQLRRRSLIAMCRKDIEELNEGNLFADDVWEDEGEFSEALDQDEFRDPNNGGEVERVQQGDEYMRVL